MSVYVTKMVGVFALGFAAGFLATKKLGRKQYTSMVEKETRQYRDALKKIIHEQKVVATKPKNPEGEFRPEVVDISHLVVRDTSEEDAKGRTLTESTKISLQENYNPFGTRTSIDYDSLKKSLVREPPENEYDDPDIRIISFEEFEDEEEYTQISLKFFDDDEVLTDDQEMPADAFYTVGDTLDKFANKAIDILYVRNDRTKAVYEVVRERYNYSEVVGGLVARPEKRKPRKMRDDAYE